MSARIVNWTPDNEDGLVKGFLNRRAFDEAAEDVARRVIAAVRRHGDKAVASCARSFDGLIVNPPGFAITPAEFEAARRAAPAPFKRAVTEACRRVTAFAQAGMKKDWSMAAPKGGKLGEKFLPFERVGVYIPGGAAPLVSTIVMTVTLAKVAGVPEIVVCTPCGRDGKVNPALLYAMRAAGATEAYRIGGIQSIAAMACGTATIAKVQKIVGPGGAFVTAAKRQVYGDVALDLVAGPSEIAVLADASADPAFVAADLLSQAEHGTGHEKAVLVTSSARLANSVLACLERQASALGRQAAIRRVMNGGMLLIVVDSIERGMELCNRLAPEHLELMVKNPMRWLSKVRCAGAVFVGPWTPESVGDFAAGPSHVLPTGGSATMFSGLTVDDFRRRTSFMSFTKADLKDVMHVINEFSAVEGLDGHGNSARIRFKTK